MGCGQDAKRFDSSPCCALVGGWDGSSPICQHWGDMGLWCNGCLSMGGGGGLVVGVKKKSS
jgi:hypothetical protein